MAFIHSAGVTAAGAADEIVAWFATFQAWMISIGWTVESGTGTTDVVFRSLSEAGGLTMLFIHVYRDGGFPNRVRIEVMDDAIGTHTTAEGGYLDGAGAQFAFWMSGDMDAIVVCFRGGATYHTVYAGLVLPFALTVPDETYRMIATSTQVAGSILRDSGGVWDVDDIIYNSSIMDDAMVDRYDGSFPLCGTHFGTGAVIAGQLKHISGYIKPGGITLGNVLSTGRGSATTTWIVLQDRIGATGRYAMRTGGTLPTGEVDPVSFTAVTGVAANYPALYAALIAHATGLGWVDLGDPGVWTDGRLFYSTGESGVDDIYLGYARNGTELYTRVEDDNPPLHSYPAGGVLRYLPPADFPINYWICGDRDCIVLVFQRPAGYTMIWAGLLPSFAPGLLPPYAGASLSPYSLFVALQGHGVPGVDTAAVLRGHDGVWQQTAAFDREFFSPTNSNPNAFDGTTYLLWPFVGYEAVFPNNEILGQLRYVGFSDGGGIASMDTITIGAQVYTVFFDNAGVNFCVRTT